MRLVEHSVGAIVAVASAARPLEMVARLILLSLPYFGSEERDLLYFRGHASPESWFMTNIVLAVVACILTRRVLRRVLPRILSDMPRDVVADLVQHTWRSSTSTIWAGTYRYDLAQDMARLSKDLPVLVLHGHRDMTAPLEAVRRLATLHPNHTLLVLPDVDHYPLLREPAWCVETIRAFVDGGASHR